jgi:predicted ATP-dependent protease
LKRALQSSEIRIESLEQILSLAATVSLEPEPIPLDVKVVLVGEPLLYYLLSAYDPDFGDLFKIGADFDDRTDRDPETIKTYARLLGTLARRRGTRPLARDAVARLIEYGSRLAGDAEKLTIELRPLNDIIVEADHWAQEAGLEAIAASHVERAIVEQRRRSDRLYQRIQEEIGRGTLLIDTDGSKVGQINAISVSMIGDTWFGRPNRVSCRVRLGRGEVLDIEREVELGGPIHSKGVMILAGFLGGRFSGDQPLSLHASLVFEQSYAPVDGDSASLAELCVLLSSLADLPIHQSQAVTGAVNQLGEVQAVGGVNEKIEGFFDTCRRRGLTGSQGVLIPHANAKHLMLRSDVVEAATARQFHIWPVTTVDQAIELLTGTPAGQLGPDGRYPLDTVNHRVQARLERLSDRAATFAARQWERGA